MIECPANYFGRGKNFDLSEDPAAIQEIEKKWQEWELAHPDDPTGELALAAAEKYFEGNKSPTRTKEKEFDIEPPQNLRLQIPRHIYTQLKDWAKAKRKRPRDIVVELIEKHTKRI